MPKPTWKDYFSFSKSERISVFILLFIIFFSILGPYYYRRNFAPPKIDPVLQEQLTAILETSAKDSTVVTTAGNLPDAPSGVPAYRLFYFDPNTLDAPGFKTLGLQDKAIRTIINYRSKGGYFKHPTDIRKIYGLQPAEAGRLIPYIRIEQTTKNTVLPPDRPRQKNFPLNKIDINTATEADFKSLPGIGDVLSKRIVKFRTSIQGFKSVDDIQRTYGLPDSTFRLILPYLTISGEK